MVAEDAGAPMENPYMAVRDRALKKLQTMPVPPDAAASAGGETMSNRLRPAAETHRPQPSRRGQVLREIGKALHAPGWLVGLAAREKAQRAKASAGFGVADPASAGGV